MKLCPYCDGEAKLITGREVYPHRPDLFATQIWACMPCGAWTGCHPGTTKRMGRLANAQTRRLRVAAHAAFDPLWKSGRMSRKKAYAWLREFTGLPERECHIGWMDDDMLRKVSENEAMFVQNESPDDAVVRVSERPDLKVLDAGEVREIPPDMTLRP